MNSEDTNRPYMGLGKTEHSFDVFGVIVDARKMQEVHLATYPDIADRLGIPEEEQVQTVHDYTALMNKKPWTLTERKKGIIAAMKDPLKRGGYQDDFSQALYEDAIQVMEDIIEAGENVIAFSSRPWDTGCLPGDLGERVRFRQGDKTKPQTFKDFTRAEYFENGMKVVSHTADELPELEAAFASGNFEIQSLVYVERRPVEIAEVPMPEWMRVAVTDLREVGYTGIEEKLTYFL